VAFDQDLGRPELSSRPTNRGLHDPRIDSLIETLLEARCDVLQLNFEIDIVIRGQRHSPPPR
jgi:hypothetical protein